MEVEKYKKLTRLYVPDADFNAEESYCLSDTQAHYLRNVMRKSAGDHLRVFNGRDGEYLATIKELNKKNALIELDNKILEQKTSSDVWVLASPVKKEAFDLMIEKACELGAAKFIPVVCDHTVVHKINQERLQAISIEASEQCERLDIMSVEPLVDLKKLLNSADSKRNLMFCIERCARAIPILKAAQDLANRPLSVLIGPEGGFSGQELDSIGSLKYVTCTSLGERILRAETALISALSIIQAVNDMR